MFGRADQDGWQHSLLPYGHSASTEGIPIPVSLPPPLTSPYTVAQESGRRAIVEISTHPFDIPQPKEPWWHPKSRVIYMKLWPFAAITVSNNERTSALVHLESV